MGLRNSKKSEDHLTRARSEGRGIMAGSTLYQPSIFVSAIVTVPNTASLQTSTLAAHPVDLSRTRLAPCQRHPRGTEAAFVIPSLQSPNLSLVASLTPAPLLLDLGEVANLKAPWREPSGALRLCRLNAWARQGFAAVADKADKTVFTSGITRALDILLRAVLVNQHQHGEASGLPNAYGEGY